MAGQSDVFGASKMSAALDVDTLLEEMDVDEAEVEWRKDFIGFGAEDERRLSNLEELFKSQQDAIAEQFYENLTQYDQTVDVIERSTRGLESLKRTQSAYLVTLATGDYDLDYFKDRARIGKIHDMVDMPLKQYIGQYGVYYSLVLPLLQERTQDSTEAKIDDWAEKHDVDAPTEELKAAIGDDIEDQTRDTLSFLRIINLDLQLAVDTYLHSYSEELRDEIEESRELRDHTEQMVEELGTTASHVATRSDDINDVTKALADNVEDVSAEVSNLSATIEEIASTATQVESTSVQAEDLAEDGRESATQAIDAMESVDTAAREVGDDIEDLRESVDEIDDIVEVINDIADQTNLLALNASIEAARAGEAGDGFAVVADEVKSLAEESQQQASEIEAMIADIQNNTEETVESITEANEQINEGVNLVEETMQNLTDIVEAVQEAAQGIGEVADATNDQAETTEQVAAMIDDVVEQADTVTNAVDDIATANQQQRAMVNTLAESVQKLKADEEDFDHAGSLMAADDD